MSLVHLMELENFKMKTDKLIHLIYLTLPHFFNLLFIGILMFVIPDMAHGQTVDYLDEDISQEEIQDRRNHLIQMGYLSVDPSPDLSYSGTVEAFIINSRYLNKNAHFSTTSSRSTDFYPDGSRIYILGRDTENIAEYRLDSPWDITTSSYRRELDISGEMGSASQPESVAHGLYFRKTDGNKLWVFNRTEIWEYTMSSSWNITTATQTGYKYLGDEVMRGHDIDFRPDGRVLYIEDRVLEVIFQYNLSTPWDITTANLDISIDIPNQNNAVQGIQFNPDGDRLYMVDTGMEEIFEYFLTTPYDLRSATFAGSYSLSSQMSDPVAITFDSDFDYFYITSEAQNRVYQYEYRLPPDPVLSTISVSESKVQANDQNSARITVIARNENGERLEGFLTELKAVSGNLDSSPSSMNTNSNGEARFDVTNNSVEQVVYQAVSGGRTLDNTVSVNFIGIDAENSFLNISENRVQANSESFAEITVNARDEDNNPFSNLRFQLIADGGSSTVENVQRTTDSDGLAIFRVRSETAESVIYSARGLSTTILEKASIDFLGVDPVLSTISVSNDRIQANGDDTAEIVIQLRDEDNRPFTFADVELIPDQGSSSIQVIQSTTGENGHAIFRVSNSTIERVQYTIRSLGVTLNTTAVVDFVPLAPVALSASNVETRNFNANWELVSGAGGYFLDVSTDSLVNTDFLEGYNNRNVGEVTSHTVQNAQPGTTYYYVARASVGDLIGADSEIIKLTTFPDTPVASPATDLNALSFTAQWEAAEGARNYRLDVALDPDFEQILPDYNNRNVGLELSVPVTNLELGSTYYYRVRSEAGPRISENSNTVSARTLSISPELSIIEQEQLRIMANGIQGNEITIVVISDEGVALKGLNVDLIPDGGQSVIEPVQAQTDDEGIAIFNLSNIQAEKIVYTVTAHNMEVGSFEVEYLSALGDLTLHDNYPNPFTERTILPVTIPNSMDIEIKVYDVLGRNVSTVIREQLNTGYYEIPFHPIGLPSGVYFYRLFTDGKVMTEKMLLVK